MSLNDYISVMLLGISGGFTTSVIFSLLGFAIYKALKFVERGK